MGDLEFKSVIENKGIDLLENINFASVNEELIFLKKLEKLISLGSKIEFLNLDLIKIILELELSDKILSKFKKINWGDFIEIFNGRDIDKRKKKNI